LYRATGAGQGAGGAAQGVAPGGQGQPGPLGDLRSYRRDRRGAQCGRGTDCGGQSPGSTLYTIAQDLTKMLVYAKTDESDVGNIHEGAVARFKVDAFPRDTFTGRVIQIRMNPQTVQNVVTYDTVVEFDNPDQKLLPGMTAYVTIPVAEARNVLKIPNGALRLRLGGPERQGLFTKYNFRDRAGGGRPGMNPAGDGAAGPGGPGGEGRPGAAGAGGKREGGGAGWKGGGGEGRGAFGGGRGGAGG